jgi:hypothetical protein
MNRTWTTAFGAAFFLVVAMFASDQGFCQAAYTATQNLPPFSVFAGASSVDSDYGTKNQSGFFAGLDYTRNVSHIYVVPSLELRASISPMGENVAEHTYQAGFKLEHAYLGRLHPYGEALFGYGTIRYRPGLFGPNGTSDSSVVPSYGGGIDVDVYKNIAVKVDFLQSYWNTGEHVTYSPSSFNFGVLYRIPFGRR